MLGSDVPQMEPPSHPASARRLPRAALAAVLLLAPLAAAVPAGAEDIPGCAPTGLTAVLQDGVIYVQWNATAGATAYDVYRDPGQGELVYFTTVYAPETSTSDSDVRGGIYRYS